MTDDIHAESMRMLEEIVTKPARHRGKYCAELEKEFAEAVGTTHAVSMNSAMSVLHCAVAASGAGPGDEVIVDPVMVFAAIAVMYADAIPVFADIERYSMNVDPESIRSKINERTKAIVVCHCYGNPCKMDAISAIAKEHGLLLIEDAAHALFAEYGGKNIGAWGDLGSFSFCEKHIGTGDGGMATTSSDSVRQFLLDNSGPTFSSVAHFRAWNYRMNEATAAVGLPQLRRGKEIVGLRMKSGGYYNEAVADCPWLVAQQVPKTGKHAHLNWAGVFDGRKHGVAAEDFQKAAAEVGCSLGYGYTGLPAYEHPAVKEYLATGRGRALGAPLPEETANPSGSCPVAEELMHQRDIVSAVSGVDTDAAQANAEKLRKALDLVGS